MPALSIIIPSYNRADLTARAVQSVLDQTWQDFEVIVVDDGSREEEVYDPRRANDSRVRLIRQPSNQGVSVARNTGIAQAQAPLIALLDSDDYWFPQKLESQLKLSASLPPDAGRLIYSTYYREQQGQWISYPLGPWPQGQALSDFLFIDGGCVHISTWLGSKSLYEKFPFNPALAQPEDVDVLLRMEAAGVRFVCCDVPAGIRTCDLREDRLSTCTNVTVQQKFFDLNRRYFTPYAEAVFRSVVLDSAPADESLFRKLRRHIKNFWRNPGLSVWDKVGLTFRYISARFITRFRVAQLQRPAGSI